MKLLNGKVTIVTGATRGIGKSIAETLASHGSSIAFTYVSSDEKARALENELLEKGVKAKGYKSNAASLEECQKLIDSVIEEFGKIDVLINNAGITRDTLIMRMSEEQWDEVINTNLKSVFSMTKAIIRPFLKQRSGSIINMSSVVGIKGQEGQANYAASKAGIIGFSKSVAKELGSRNIRCNTITPGFIQTEMTGILDDGVVEKWMSGIALKRAGKPEDVANLALYLASDLSSYVTGQTVSVCGGLSL